jgi:arginine decarboxylase
VVAPTYHGAMPDVRALAEVTHAHGAALVVDEAWGAHLAFHPALPEHAIAAGADLVISSTHKSLGSLSGSAMLHRGPDAEHRLPEAAVSEALALTETTSPSALALASLDAARARAVSSGRELLSATVREIAAARRRLARIPGVRVLGPEVVWAPGVQGFDPLRLTVDLHGTGRDARDVAGVLDSHSRIALEFATDRLLVAAFGIADGELGAGAALCDALVPALLRVPCRTPRRARAVAPRARARPCWIRAKPGSALVCACPPPTRSAESRPRR